MPEDEFELVPISPLRRLEKRIEKLESAMTSNDKEFYKEMVGIIRINQQIVSELVKANDALRLEISRLPTKIEELVSKLDELLNYIKASTEETPSIEPTLVQRIDQLIETNKKVSESLQSIISSLEGIERKVSRPIVPIRKPLVPAKPKI